LGMGSYYLEVGIYTCLQLNHHIAFIADSSIQVTLNI